MEEVLEEVDLPDIDFLDIPEIQDAKIDAQATLMAKREDLDRAWLDLKEKEQEEAREREREAAEKAAAEAAERKEESTSSHSSGSTETAEHGSGRDLGQFKLTAYCPCYSCSEGWGRMTSSGRLAQERHTIATDPNVIPEGTKVEINGVVYTAEDIGGGVRGNHIDIFYESHEECLEFGVRYAEVYKVN
ncbi:MAG: 3D domain-containing protein [Stomatobaculum sp.]|nr:3D domain-containing protein [Stomatobaculum sp.]